MKIGITGVNGFIGSHLAERLVAAGHRVRGLVRRTSDLRWVRTLPIELVYGDLRDVAALEALAAGRDVVLHCAARTKAPNESAMMATNLHGTRNAVDACSAAGARRFVFFSSLEAVGDARTREPLTEEVPLEPITSYGRSKAQAEDVVRRSGLDYIILRPPPVYGPRDTDVYIYFRIIDAGFRPVLPARASLSVCAWKSLVGAAERACDPAVPPNGTYFVADGGVYTWDSLTATIADAMGVRTLRVPLPRAALVALAAASRAHARLTGSLSILNPEKLRMFDVENLCVSIRAARDTLGFRPADTGGALAETVEWYRSAGWLKNRRPNVAR